MSTAFELDHVFVCAAPGAPEADALVSRGLLEGQPNTHPGQGTSNRRFFFHNAMLELLWVHDETEARSPSTRRTRLFERWSRRAGDACPFGLCFRPAHGVDLPFPGWAYAPRYLPPSLSVHVGGNSERMDEPMLFHLPFATRPDQAPREKRPPLAHHLPLRELTRVTWVTPNRLEPSIELCAAMKIDGIFVARGPAHALELGFDDEPGEVRLSLRPHLPLTLCW